MVVKAENACYFTIVDAHSAVRLREFSMIFLVPQRSLGPP
jgi:hypothetical protein